MNIEETDNNLPQLRWSVRLPDRIERDPCLSFDRQLIYIAHLQGSLSCLDTKTGNIVWSTSTEDSIKCHPVCISSLWVLCGSYDKHLYCWHQLTGQLQWKLNVDNSSILSISAEIDLNDNLPLSAIVSTAKGTIALVHVDSCNIIWQRNLNPTPIFSTASINQKVACGVIGLVNNSIVSVSLIDGHTLWEYSTQTPVFCSGVQLQMPNKKWAILFGLNDSQIICLSISQGVPLWIHSTNPKIRGSPSICLLADLIVVIEKTGSISFIRKKDGLSFRFRCKQEGSEKYSLADTFNLGDHEVFARPVIYNKHLYLGGRDSCVHCLSLENNNS